MLWLIKRKTFYYFILLIASLISWHPWMSLVIIVLAWCPAWAWSRITLLRTLKIMIVPLIFLCFALIPLVITLQVQPFRIGSTPYHWQQAFSTGLRTIASLSSLLAWIHCTPPWSLLTQIARLPLPNILIEHLQLSLIFLSSLQSSKNRAYKSATNRAFYLSGRHALPALALLINNLFLDSLRQGTKREMGLLVRASIGPIRFLPWRL